MHSLTVLGPLAQQLFTLLASLAPLVLLSRSIPSFLFFTSLSLFLRSTFTFLLGRLAIGIILERLSSNLFLWKKVSRSPKRSKFVCPYQVSLYETQIYQQTSSSP